MSRKVVDLANLMIALVLGLLSAGLMVVVVWLTFGGIRAFLGLG